jgi:hypothetical protein
MTFELTFPAPHEAIYLAVWSRERATEIVPESAAATVNVPFWRHTEP